MALKFRISETFFNREALKNVETENLFDPSDIQIKVIDSTDNSINHKPTPIRLSRGKYIADIDSTNLIILRQYSIRWNYNLFPGSPQVKRSTFIFQDAKVELNGMCNVFGNVSKFGLPSEDQIIEIALRKEGFSRHFNSSQMDTITDLFGNFTVLLPRGETVQIYIPTTRERKLFIVPDLSTKDFDEIEDIQEDIETDAFGNLV